MLLQKQNDYKTIETFKVEGNKNYPFYVDIVKDNIDNCLEAYLYCADYSQKVLMFGVPSEAENAREELLELKNFEELVSNNLPEHIYCYYEDFIKI